MLNMFFSKIHIYRKHPYNYLPHTFKIGKIYFAFTFFINVSPFLLIYISGQASGLAMGIIIVKGL